MIAYKATKAGFVVFLDGKRVGIIKYDNQNRWFYVPKGTRAKDVPDSEKSPYLKQVTTWIEGDTQ